MVRSAIAFLFVFAAVAAAGLAQNTWVVDKTGGPGSHYREIQRAVDVARHGDRIEVRATGSYAAFTTTKSLDIEGVGGRPTVASAVVTGLPPGTMILENLALGLNRTAPNALAIRGCQGTVVVRAVVLQFSGEAPTCEVIRSTVAFVSVFVPGQIVLWHPAFRVEDSQVRLRQCGIRGGDIVFTPRADGLPAIEIVRSHIVVTRSDLIGGEAGPASLRFGSCDPGGRGGAAIQGTGTVLVAGGTCAGGRGGSGQGYANCQGPLGYSIDVTGSVRVTRDAVLIGTYRTPVTRIGTQPALETSPETLLGGPFAAAVIAPAGANVTLFVALRPGWAPLFPAFEYPVLVGTDAAPVATLAATGGTDIVGLRAPNTGSLRGRLMIFQAVVVGSNTVWLSNASETRVR